MSKDFRVYLDDIIDSCNKIAQYTQGYNQKKFEEDLVLQDAVIRRLEIIGEATKRLPKDFRDRHSDIEWKKATGMRDILIHNYDEIDHEQIWLTLMKDLPTFRLQVEQVLHELDKSDTHYDQT